MQIIKNQILLLCLSLIILLSGCKLVGDPYAPTILTPQLVHSKVLGHSIENRPIELISLGSGPVKVLIIATIHGNEDAGTPLAFNIVEKLRIRPAILENRSVLIVPIANPDGFAHGTRGNLSGIDLNRNFPASNRINNDVNGQNGLTEPESTILHDLILAEKPNHIVAIHQPLYCLDYDGPAGNLAEAMSNFCPLPVKKLGSRPGSLGSFAGVDQNIPIVTMELAKSDSKLTSDQLWIKYGYALLAAITYPEACY